MLSSMETQSRSEIFKVKAGRLFARQVTLSGQSPRVNIAATSPFCDPSQREQCRLLCELVPS